VALQAAIKKEVVDGDLKSALEQYRKLAQKGTPRPVAARALFQVGQCHEKLGNAEARKAYERLVMEFADQAEPARLARVRLAALGGPGAGGRLVTRRVLTDASGVGGVLTPDGKYIVRVRRTHLVKSAFVADTGRDEQSGDPTDPQRAAGVLARRGGASGTERAAAA